MAAIPNCRTWAYGALLCYLLPVTGLSQDTPVAEPPAAAEAAPPGEPSTPPSLEAELALKQSNLADKYARLEKLLFDLSALEAAENPARAALLRRAYQQSADQLTKKQMDAVSQLLARSELKRAMDEQGEVTKDLKALLELLLSEDRSDRLKGQQERIREYIREVDRILRKQIDLHGQNEGGTDAQRLAGEQGKLSNRTQGLAEKIAEDEAQHAAENSPNDNPEAGEPPTDEDAEQKPTEQAPAESAEPKEGQPGDGQEARPAEPAGGEQEMPPMPGESSEPKPAENSEAKPEEQGDQPPQNSDGSPMPGDPSEQQPSEQQPSQQQPGQPSQQQSGDMPPQDGEAQPSDQQQQQSSEHPAVKRLAEAFKRMREAQLRLEEAKRKEALEEQEKAEAELEKLKAELEEILRQLREEEVGRTLELLESRFRKMLELELRVYEATKRMDQIPEKERARDFAIQANNVSADQRKIALEADRALILLEEEGSSVSFPEAVEQLRDEMYLVSERLAELKTGFVTQESQESIIAELEELIAAFQKAQQEKDQRQQQQQQPPGEPGEEPLVDKLAELKMIRALQMRVNTRTQRFARLLADIDDPVGQVTDAELREHIQQLAEREQRIHNLTRDLILGKNK